MSSSGLVEVVRPGGRLVVGCAGFEASVEDADESVGELAQGGVVAGAAGALPVVVHEPGRDGLLLPGRTGDRAGRGVVLAGLGRHVAGMVVTELGEHPGAEDGTQSWLGCRGGGPV